MEEARVTLADGRVFESTTVLEFDGNLFLYIRDEDETLKTVFDELYGTGNSATVTARRYGEDRVYTGYTELASLRKEPDGQITVGLRKGA